MSKFNSYDICKNCWECFGNHRHIDGACPTFFEDKKFELWKNANPLDAQVSFAEPNQQLFTIAEVESYLERQKEICKQQYNLYCTDRELPISDVCRKMILDAPTPNIVKS